MLKALKHWFESNTQLPPLTYRNTEIRRCMMVANVVFAIATPASLLLMGMFAYLNARTSAACSAIILATSFLALRLSFSGRSFMARSLFLSAKYAAVLTTIVMHGDAGSFSIFFMTGLVFTATFFSFEEKRSITFFTLLFGFSYFATPYFAFALARPLPTDLLASLQPLMRFSAVIAVFLVIYAYVKVNSTQYQELSNHRLRLLQSSRSEAIKEIAASVAHEVNNPLAIIQGRVDQSISQLEQATPEFVLLKKNLISISHMISRVGRIVRALQELGHGQEKSPFGKTYLKEIINHALHLCSDRFQSFGIELRVVDPNPNLTLKCRPTEVTQILLNMLNNAFEATRYSEEKWVKITTEDLGNRVLISITDSGPGIPKEFRERIMEPFFSTKSGNASGLGLTIARSFAFGHHGSLELNTKTENTQFLLILPKDPDARTEAAVKPEEPDLAKAA